MSYGMTRCVLGAVVTEIEAVELSVNEDLRFLRIVRDFLPSTPILENKKRKISPSRSFPSLVAMRGCRDGVI